MKSGPLCLCMLNSIYGNSDSQGDKAGHGHTKEGIHHVY